MRPAVVALVILIWAGTAAAEASWTRYRAFRDQLQFSYPADLLSVTVDSNQVTLGHSVPFRHPELCDFEGGEDVFLDHLLDFHLSLEIDPRPVMEAMKNWFAFTVVPRRTQRDVFGPDSLIREVGVGQIGPWTGYMVHQAGHSCGFLYYFLNAGDCTLVARRAVVTAFFTTYYDTAMTLPGVITPGEADELFVDIIRTVAIAVTDGVQHPARKTANHGGQDQVPPTIPVITTRRISRGYGTYGDGERTVAVSDSDEGSISLEVHASDDRTPADSLRYRLRYVEGTLPQGLVLDGQKLVRASWMKDRPLIVRWNDERVWSQDAFLFTMVVTAVDLAGNESQPSAPILLAHDGDPSDIKERIGDASDFSFTEDQIAVRAFDVMPPTLPAPPVPHPELQVYEFPMTPNRRPTSGSVPSASATAPGDDALVTAPRISDPRWKFVLDGVPYTLEIIPKKKRRSRLEVRKHEERVYSVEPSANGSVVTFYGWKEPGQPHWVLEYTDHVVVDGQDLNERHNYQRTFFYRIVDGRPFYFARVHGKIRLCWGTKVAPETYDEVLYEPGSLDTKITHYENKITFYARRERQWLFVEAGNFKK